ncbi:MAG: SMI1/KNR4 family protein, partial [Clostridiales bacterium]|nr:SMI1/KNR4 family protein [Clostridiales bacterium]
LQELINIGDEEYGEYFAQFLYDKNNQTSYYALLGYSCCMQDKSYSKLIEIIFNTTMRIDFRVYALYELSIISGQRFIKRRIRLYEDERTWTESDLSLEEISAWDKADRPKGTAYEPHLHDKVQNPDPNNPIDGLISTINKKYYKKAYVSRSDIIGGTVNIGKPTNDEVADINKKYILPPTYKYFIENFVVKNELKQAINVYSADELVKRQFGFAYAPDGGLIPEWDQNRLVIADWNGDTMYCLNLSLGETSPIYQFYHDDWKFKKYANSFLDFLTKII